MSLHEPAIVALLDEEFRAERELQTAASSLLAAGDIEGGIRAFVASVGGDWLQMPEAFKAVFRQNAHNYAGATFFADPARALRLPTGLDELPHPVQFTKGDRSPRYFHASIDRVSSTMQEAEITTIQNAGHAAMLDCPGDYAATLSEFIQGSAIVRR